MEKPTYIIYWKELRPISLWTYYVGAWDADTAQEICNALTLYHERVTGNEVQFAWKYCPLGGILTDIAPKQFERMGLHMGEVPWPASGPSTPEDIDE